MRWDDLFADLAAQLEQAAAAELADEVADRTRRELAALTLADRARASGGATVTVLVAGAGSVSGRLGFVGEQWLLVHEDAGREALVPLAAVLSVAGLTPWSAAPGSAGRVAARLGLGSALRGLARDRCAVAVGLRDGTVLTGTLERVAADFVELSVHGAGEPRPRGVGVRAVPWAGLAVVRRAG